MYFVTENFGYLKSAMNNYCASLHRPFHARHDPLRGIIEVDRAIQRLPKTSTLRIQAAKQAEYFEKNKAAKAEEPAE